MAVGLRLFWHELDSQVFDFVVSFFCFSFQACLEQCIPYIELDSDVNSNPNDNININSEHDNTTSMLDMDDSDGVHCTATGYDQLGELVSHHFISYYQKQNTPKPQKSNVQHQSKRDEATSNTLTPVQSSTISTPLLHTIASKASPKLIYNVLNVLLAYVSIARLYNGNLLATTSTTDTKTAPASSTNGNHNGRENDDDHVVDVARDVLRCTEVLSQDARYTNAASSINAFVQISCTAFANNPMSMVQPLQDVMQVCASACCVTACLSELIEMFKKTLHVTKQQERNRKQEMKQTQAARMTTQAKTRGQTGTTNAAGTTTPRAGTARKSLKQALKKIEYMAAWSKLSVCTEGNVLPYLCQQVRTELTLLEDRLRERQQAGAGTTMNSSFVINNKVEDGVRSSGVRLVEEL